MQKIWDLIRLDIITMNGGKNSMRTSIILLAVFWGVVGFVFSPAFGVICPIMVGTLSVPMLFQNEIKYHSEKLHSLLPVSRRDLVSARFLFFTVMHTAVFLIFYLIMLTAHELRISYLIIGEDAREMDMMRLIIENLGQGITFTESGLFNLLYFSSYAFGLMTSTKALKNYFKNSELFSSEMNLGKNGKDLKKEYIMAAVILAIVMLWALVITGILPLGTALLPVMMLFLQLAQAADGFLLGAVIVTIAVFAAIYNYIGTVLEYEEKEL